MITMIVFLAIVTLALAEKKYFLQFTDIHMEKKYLPGSDTDKRCVAGDGDAPEIAFVGCDLSDKTVKAYLEEVAKMYPNPEFVMYNGDSNPHYLDWDYGCPYDRDDVLFYAKSGLQIIHDAFPDVPFIPIIGNHDNYPSDQLATNEEGMNHLRTLGSYFADYIPQEEVDTLVTKGYYIHDISEDMRIIVMTTVFCDLVNFYATCTGGEKDIGMFAAVTDELEKARQEGKYVLLAFHRPAGRHETSSKFSDLLPLCRNKFDAMYKEYKDILTYGSFTGHTHKNSFRIFTDVDGKPIHTQFVSTGLTTYDSQQAGSAVFFYDEETHTVTDWIQLYLDTDESNKEGKVVVKAYNSFAEDFGIADLRAESMYEVFRANVQSKTSQTFKNYYNRLYTNYAGAPRVTNKVWAEAACCSGPVDPGAYADCVDKLSAGEPYDAA